MNLTGVQLAIKQAGGVGKLASLLGIKSQAVSIWNKKGEIPVKRVADVSRVTHLKKSLLHPDFQ